MKIGNIQAELGQKAKGIVKVAEAAGFDIELPVCVVNGNESGPTVAVVAGIHPVEYPIMEGSIRLYNQLNPSELKGSIIFVPVLNIPGFKTVDKGSPWERTPITAAFPGDPNGSINERTAHFVTTQVLEKADYAVEGHSCNLEMTCPYNIILRRTEDRALFEKSLHFARCFRNDYVRSAMEQHTTKLPEKGHSVMIQALKMGIPCILPEAGSAGGINYDTGQLNEDNITWFTDGMITFMKSIDMLKGEHKLYDPWAVKNVLHLRAGKAGWFYPMAANGAKVIKGTVVAEIRDFFGKVLEQLQAPVDGVISLIWTRPAVDQGNYLIQMFELGPKSSTL
ncbi:succinylglutamate desuccinylase/aspartoacylase family protein [Thermoproteota archaeon]